MTAFAIFSANRPLTTNADIFGAAVVAEAWAGLVIYALLNAFIFQRGQPLRTRGPAMAGAVFLLGLSVVSLF